MKINEVILGVTELDWLVQSDWLLSGVRLDWHLTSTGRHVIGKAQ